LTLVLPAWDRCSRAATGLPPSRQPDYTIPMPTDMPELAVDASGAILFEALIVPHSSLSAAGRRWLMLALSGLCSLVALGFWLLGAWPIIGFCVLEGAGALYLVYLSGRRSRGSELVLLSADTLRVVRTTPAGKRSQVVLSSAWLNVMLEETTGRVPRLLLGLRARWVEVGAALGDAEKRDLAAALREALYRARNPRFDNSHFGVSGVRPPSSAPST
jgi:uncharacterized membrane protein